MVPEVSVSAVASVRPSRASNAETTPPSVSSSSGTTWIPSRDRTSGLDRRQHALEFRLAVGPDRQLGLELRVVGLEPKLDRAGRCKRLHASEHVIGPGSAASEGMEPFHPGRDPVTRCGLATRV